MTSDGMDATVRWQRWVAQQDSSLCGCTSKSFVIELGQQLQAMLQVSADVCMHTVQSCKEARPADAACHAHWTLLSLRVSNCNCLTAAHAVAAPAARPSLAHTAASISMAMRIHTEATLS